ncbi:MAG: molybdenum cofactor guanylyltransferase [Bacteroidales bacterium]|nr:molybdenum cofactor guanylyltransferase [Bacteroidales bacterium]
MLVKGNFIIIDADRSYCYSNKLASQIIGLIAANHAIISLKFNCIDENASDCNFVKQNNVKSQSFTYEINEIQFSDSVNKNINVLKSGAKKVFQIYTHKNYALKACMDFLNRIPENSMVIVESNSLRDYMEPGLFFVFSIENANSKSKKVLSHLADKIVVLKDSTLEFEPERVMISQNKWCFKHKATAIILAGGKSSRMEGAEKSLLNFNGKPLIQHIVEQLDMCFDQVIIGSNEPDKFKFLNKEVIPDIEKNKGPLMGIMSCLKSSKNECNFITACDIPEMNINLINRMISMSSDVDIVMPVSENEKYEPLYAVYNKKVITFAEEILKNNGRKITNVLKYAKVEFVDFDNETWYFNINRKSDFIEFIKSKNYCNKSRLINQL